MQLYPPLVEGNAESRVRVVTYEDLQCKDCAWLRKKMDELILPAFSERVAFEHRDFPLPKHDWARPAAMVARHFTAVSHGVAVAFRRDILADMSIITASSLPDWIREFAADYGVDAEAALAAINDTAIGAAIDADVASARDRNVQKTPTVFVGETAFIEWVPVQELTAAIESAL